MYIRTTGHLIALTSLLFAVPGCLDQGGQDTSPGQTAGTLRGVIVDDSGTPVPGARVIVDDLDGPVGFAGKDGAFTLDGVGLGAHELHAIDDLGDRGATVRFEMKEAEEELAPVELEPCGTAVQPCGQFDAEPVNAQLVIDELVLETQFGQVLADNLAVSGESSDRLTFLKFAVPGDFSGGGTLSLDDPGAAGVASLLSMIDANGVHFYALASGEIEIEVTAGGDGHDYQFIGTNLVLVYQQTTGEIVNEYTVEIGSLTLAGRATPIDQAAATR
jgi:hypothetical protein